MTSSTAATPPSESNTTSNAAGPRLAAPKDKSCPFCHQAFTSSSLGRHLDLYIKPKNPKAPDGVHHVDEIRKLRGGITRRQARTSSVKKEASAPASATRPPGSFTGDESPVVVHSPAGDDDPVHPSKLRTSLNTMHWHATGVINNLPPRQAPAHVPDQRRAVSVSRHVQHAQHKAELEQRHRTADEWETGRAAELALREVLATFKHASARLTASGPFDFDPFAVGFAGLCLRILTPPATLFSPAPFPSPDSWSISPPGRKQFDALGRLAQEAYKTYYGLRPPNQSTTPPSPNPDLFEDSWYKLACHLGEAWSHWQTLSREQQQDAWQLEILRSYHRSNDVLKQAQAELDAARQEIEQLKAAQWAPGPQPQYPQFPAATPPATLPATLHIGTDLVKQFAGRETDLKNWDYDRLLEKWKAVVRDNRNSANGMAAQRSLSVASTQPLVLGSRSCSMTHVPATGLPTANGADGNPNSNSLPHNGTTPTHVYSAPATTSGSADGDAGDHMDGEGEDEDADADVDAEDAPEEVSLSDQRQQLQHQQHQQQQYRAQAQAHAQAQAQAQKVQQAQAQAAWHNMNRSRNQQRQPQQHMAQNPQAQHMHMHSRRSSQAMAMLDHKTDHAVSSSGMMPMEGIENSADGFLGGGMSLGMGLTR